MFFSYKNNLKFFTLIELLVVISIIAFIAGLLLPVFTIARKSAYSSNCRNNLRQSSYYMHLYTDDNKDFMMITPNYNISWWLILIDVGYLKTFDFVHCPDSRGWKFSSRDFSAATAKVGYGHRVNEITDAILSFEDSGYYWNIRNILHPSLMLVIGDSFSMYKKIHQNPFGTRHHYVKISQPYADISEDFSSYFDLSAHNNSGNFLFWEGHVESISLPSDFGKIVRTEYIARGYSYFRVGVWKNNYWIYE